MSSDLTTSQVMQTTRLFAITALSMLTHTGCHTSRSAWPQQPTPSPQSVAPACAGRGPVECATSSADLTDPCKQLASCIEKLGDADSGKPVFVYRCEAPARLSAPHEAGALAVLRVEADQGERYPVSPDDDFAPHPNAGEAAFLLADHAGGWCLIDQLLGWDWDTMGRIEETYDAKASRANGAIELEIVTEHVSRLELDADERENGEDDVRYASCVTSRYALAFDRYTRIKATVADGSCTRDR